MAGDTAAGAGKGGASRPPVLWPRVRPPSLGVSSAVMVVRLKGHRHFRCFPLWSWRDYLLYFKLTFKNNHQF